MRTSKSILQTHHFVLPAAHAPFGIADVHFVLQTFKFVLPAAHAKFDIADVKFGATRAPLRIAGGSRRIQ